MSWQWMQLRWILIDFGCSWWWQQQRDGGDFQRTDIWLAAWQQHDGGIFSRLWFAGCVVEAATGSDSAWLIAAAVEEGSKWW
jgi:hypothetical protein